MDYNASRTALYKPEARDPVEGFSAAWPLDHVCAELSRLAYYRFDEGDRPRLEAALSGAGFTGFVPFNERSKGAQGFGTLAPDGTAFVVFRGTQPDALLDLIADIRFKLVPCPSGGSVHQGFLDAYASLSDASDNWLAATGAARIVATGHSLGAAMATLLAAAHPDSTLVTFGSPRVGNRDFADPFAGRSVRRYVDCTDKVTAVAPELIGYRHVAGERYIDRLGIVHPSRPDASAVADDQSAARKAYLKKHAWKVWRNVLFRELADHAPINYVSAVLGVREPD